MELEPNNVNALFSRASCYNKLGNYEKAVDDYYLAIEKDTLNIGRKPIFKNVQKVLGLNSNENSNKSHNYSVIDKSNYLGIINLIKNRQ